MKIEKCSKWDGRFFSVCSLVASWSEDPSRKVGCVLVGGAKEIIATGYNGLPRGVSHSDTSRFSREGGEKYKWFEHAERNAIFNAARVGVSLNGSTMYCSSFPCAHCARAIIQSGIKEIKTFEYEKDDPRFGDEFPVSEKMFEEAGVTVRIYSSTDELITQIST